MSDEIAERLEKEQRLVQRLRERDSEALATLYDNYSGALLGVICRLVKHEGQAEEVLQDTFMKIWNKIDSYSSEKGRFYTWMYRIARNLALDKLKSREYSKMRLTDNLEDKSRILSESEESELMNNPFAEDLLKYLNEDQAFVLQKMYFQGYSGEDVSKSYDIPLGTVKSRVRSALKKLRKVYGVK